MKVSAITVLALTGLAASASYGATATAYLRCDTSFPLIGVAPGTDLSFTVYATGDQTIFSYNLLADVTQGADKISHVFDLVDNPTGSSSIFGAPAGDGLGAGTGLGVDRRDASSGILIAPVPIDTIPLFTFKVHVADDVKHAGYVTYELMRGTGTNNAALTYPNTSVPPIVYGTDYENINFGSVMFWVIPSPSSLACIGLMGLAASRRRRA